MTLRIALLLAALTLAACDQPPTSSAPTLRPVASSPNAGPGSKSASLKEATQIYRRLCVATAPTFADLPTVVQAPFVQNSKFGTYYHQNFDLSVKLRENPEGKVCSMVYKSNGSLKKARAAFAALSPDITLFPGPFALYFNVRLKGK